MGSSYPRYFVPLTWNTFDIILLYFFQWYFTFWFFAIRIPVSCADTVALIGPWQQNPLSTLAGHQHDAKSIFWKKYCCLPTQHIHYKKACAGKLWTADLHVLFYTALLKLGSLTSLTLNLVLVSMHWDKNSTAFQGHTGLKTYQERNFSL